jgi:hypothetical protein
MPVFDPQSRPWSAIDSAIVVTITLLAVALRLTGLGELPLEGDEIFTFTMADERAWRPINPAYYQLVLASTSLFGQNEFAARLPAFVFGVAAVPALFICLRGRLGTLGAALAALLLVCSGWHLFLSQYARFYSAVVFFAILSYDAYFRAVRMDRLGWLLASVVYGFIAVMFHATAAFAIAGTVVASSAILLYNWRKRLPLPRSLLIHVAVFGTGGLLLLPVFWTIASGWGGTGQTWGYGPIGVLLQTAKYDGIAICAAAAFGFFLITARERTLGIVFACTLGVPLAFLAIGSAFVPVRPDYVVYTLPLVLVMAAIAAAATVGTKSRRWPFAVVAVLLLISQLPETVSEITGRKSMNIRHVAEIIDARTDPADRILAFVPGVDFYTEREIELEPYPGNPYDESVNWSTVLDPYREATQSLWIVAPRGRTDLASGLEHWLGRNARLSWRGLATRYDYTVQGFEIFEVAGREH